MILTLFLALTTVVTTPAPPNPVINNTPVFGTSFNTLWQIPSIDVPMQRFWLPYHLALNNAKNWLDSDYATMNWFGLRDHLATNGLDISFNYASDIAGNVTGGKSLGTAYCDNFTLNLEFHSEPLFGYKGGTLSIIALNRDGSNLSAQTIGNQFTVQQLYGGSTAIFYGLTYEQQFYDDRFSLKFGRMATGDDFASSPIYWLYMNNGIDGNPQSLPVNAMFTAYPWASWGARLRAQVTSETTALLGIYQVTPQIWRPSMHGLNWGINSGDGAMIVAQYGWSPEFFKPTASIAPVPAEPSDGKSITPNGGKAFTSTADGMTSHGLPGHYWLGGYYSTWTYPQFGSTQGQPGAYGLYCHFDQMLYRISSTSDTGLTAWSACTLSPQQNTAKIPFEYNGGLIYSGLIPWRPKDLSIFGVIYGNFSSNYAQTTVAGTATYELVTELGYRINMTKFAYIQPDAQWIINPGGTGTIPNALVLGAQIGVTF